MKKNHLTKTLETTLKLKSSALLGAMALSLLGTAACSSSAPGADDAFLDESGAGGAASTTSETTGSSAADEEAGTGTETGAGGALAGDDEPEQEETPEGEEEDPWDGLQLELVAEFSHPLEAPDGFTYCGADYEMMCGALSEQCKQEGGTFECHESASQIANVCDTWGSCRDKPELSFTDAEGQEIPAPSIGDIQADTENQAKCSQCNAICQTVALFGSAYDELSLGEGYTPSGCVDAAQDLCEGGASRWLFSANCVM